VPLPVARVPAKAAPLVDAADEKTDMSEVPVPQTDFGFPNVEAEMTERPAPPPEPEARPQRSGGMRASEILAAVQVDDWTMTPDASAPTVIPSSKPEPAPEVQEPTPAPKGPPTGNWTISLDPETGWGEPEKLEATVPTPPAEKPTKIEKRTPTSAQTPSTGNPVHAVASDKAIEAVQWEDKPTSIGEKIEIDPTLMEPIDPLPSLDDSAGASGGMAGFSPPRGLPAYPPAGSVPNLASASGGMAPLSAASSAELPAPLGPPPPVPSSTGSQPAFPPQDIGYAATLLPGQMTAPPGGFAYPQAPASFQGFQSESVAAVPKRSNKRLLVIAASAAAVVIIAIVLAMTMGGKHKKHVAEGKGSAGSAAVVVPPPVVIDAAVVQVQGSDTGSADGSATQQAVVPPPPQTCNVEVATTPAGAEVSLEDKTVLGQTPGTFPLPCGAATKLTIKKTKYLTVIRSVTPAPDGTKLAVTLGQGMFSVKVTSSPAGATITVSGKPKGVTPTALQLPAFTTQTIVLTKDGYATDAQKVVIKSNGLTHHVTLKKGGRRR
jgi:hypothetical protein